MYFLNARAFLYHALKYIFTKYASNCLAMLLPNPYRQAITSDTEMVIVVYLLFIVSDQMLIGYL